MTTQDEHGYPFQEEWEKRQAKPSPKSTKPKKALGIGLDEMPPLTTKENAPAANAITTGDSKKITTKKGNCHENYISK